MIICVDIDETICRYDNLREYPLAIPIPERIEKINRLYDEGNIIIYWTARGSVTGIDWKELTEQQLNKWGAKYHDCKLGKQHFDLYICDKAINAETYFAKETNK